VPARTLEDRKQPGESRDRRDPRSRAHPADRDVAGADDWVRFIGNATLLLRYGPFTILTDPNLVHRGAEVSLGFGLMATRTTDPALDAEDLPRPDLVIVSHDHGDHFDAVAADWLTAAVPMLTTPAVAPRMEARGLTTVRPLAMWESAAMERDGARLRVTAVPAQHGPASMAAALPEVMGSVIELWREAPAERDAPPDLRIYLSGDTVFHDGLAELRDRFGELDLAFLHLGGMRLMGVLVTMDATQGVQLVNLLQPRVTIPIHYNDYGTFGSPLADFVSAVNEAGLQDRVRYLRHNDAWPLVPRPR
jgi:L-ascorbate metabolism protein UlaG (beta-lactamase superfamily)